MRRKGDAELQILGLLLFLATVIQWAYMLGAPGQFQESIQRQADDTEAVVKSGAVRAHMEEEYVPQSLEDAAYQGMYERGQEGFGPWSPGDVPDWDTISGELEDGVNNQIQNNYLGAMDSGAGCSLKGQGGISAEIGGENSDAPSMTFDIENGGPLHVECESTASANSFQEGGAARAKELIAVPDDRTVDRMRYESMHQVAYRFARNRDFRQTIANTLTYSSNYVEAIGSEQYAGNCDNKGSDCTHLNSGTVSFPSFSDIKTDAEDTQSDIAEGDLQTALDETANEFASNLPARYDGIEIEVEVIEFDYTIENHHQVSDDNTERDGFRITSCETSCGEYKDEDGPKSCSTCGCSVTCTCDAEPDCPPTVCSTSGPWDRADYKRDGSQWTQNPWTTSGGGDTGVVSLYEWDGKYYSGPVASPTATRPMENGVRTLRTDFHLGGDDDCDGDSCSCVDIERADNDVHQTPRRVWQIDQLSSNVVVEVRVRDTENRIPAGSGFENPVFTFDYEQESTWDFTGAPSVVG